MTTSAQVANYTFAADGVSTLREKILRVVGRRWSVGFVP
jgi:hypothetical protein